MTPVPMTPAPIIAAPKQQSTAGRVVDAVDTGFRFIARLLVSMLWGAGAYAAFASGAWLFGLLAILYLVYLWVLRGRWLIY